MTIDSRLRLRDVRTIFRLIGEVRELGSDPQRWRPHMVRKLRTFFSASIIISSEIHFRKAPGSTTMRLIDIGWACDSDDSCWQIKTERDGELPANYWLQAGQPLPTAASEPDQMVPVKPTVKLHGGTCFLLSQVTLPHVGAVDQLGIHRASGDEPFTAADHKLLRLFHLELGRLWKKDALQKAKDPHTDLPPRLSQTLAGLVEGLSEKQIAIRLELSQHTVHNYIKALHQRFEVNSRGELLAKVGKLQTGFLPKLSL